MVSFCGKFSPLVNTHFSFFTLVEVSLPVLLSYIIPFLGDSPYPGVKPREVATLLERGYRMPRPNHLSEEL